jgi:hypothetical protein
MGMNFALMMVSQNRCVKGVAPLLIIGKNPLFFF